MSGWNLPPGVTNDMIERAARCCECWCETCACVEDDDGNIECEGSDCDCEFWKGLEDWRDDLEDDDEEV